MAEPATKVTLVTILATVGAGAAAPMVAELSVTFIAACFGAYFSMSMAQKDDGWGGPTRHVISTLGFTLFGAPLVALISGKLMGVDTFDALPASALAVSIFWRNGLRIVPSLLEQFGRPKP